MTEEQKKAQLKIALNKIRQLLKGKPLHLMLSALNNSIGNIAETIVKQNNLNTEKELDDLYSMLMEGFTKTKRAAASKPAGENYDSE